MNDSHRANKSSRMAAAAAAYRQRQRENIRMLIDDNERMRVLLDRILPLLGRPRPPEVRLKARPLANADVERLCGLRERGRSHDESVWTVATQEAPAAQATLTGLTAQFCSAADAGDADTAYSILQTLYAACDARVMTVMIGKVPVLE